MTLTERQSAAGEAATSVSMLERPAQCRRNSPRPRTDVRNSASWVVSLDDAARIARQALRRFCRNARAGFEDRLTWRVRVGEHLGIDVDDHLVALPRRTRINAVVERRLYDEGQGIGLLLGQRRRVVGDDQPRARQSVGWRFL